MSRYARDPKAVVRDLIVAFRKKEEIGNIRPIEYLAQRNGCESPIQGER